jgi:hypothetical protein
MKSNDPADWDRALSEYFTPLNNTYPDHAYRSEVEAYAQQIEDQAALRRAIAAVQRTSAVSDAQRFYQRGLRLCQQGDADAARQVWKNVVWTFGNVHSEHRWVQLCEVGLQELSKRTPDKRPDGTVQEVLRQARQFRDQGQRAKADEIWIGLETLYRDDPSGEEVLREIKRDRGP